MANNQNNYTSNFEGQDPADLKDYVDSNVLRIAPPEAAGDGEVIMYRGTLV